MFNKDSITIFNKKTFNSVYSLYGFSMVGYSMCDYMYLFIPKHNRIFILPEKIKVDINGKVFKWYSSPKVWRFLVHYSHLSNLVFLENIFFFKSVGKNRYVIFSKKRSHSYILKNILKCVRYSNLFTGRGIKYTPRKFFKKQGKISTYI